MILKLKLFGETQMRPIVETQSKKFNFLVFFSLSSCNGFLQSLGLPFWFGAKSFFLPFFLSVSAKTSKGKSFLGDPF